MKSLKFEHSLAKLVSSGEVTSTWRLYDDKDLSVGDQIRFIDKVDQHRPETWRAMGVARVNTIIQKRLGDIGPEDYQGHEKFSSKEEMIRTYQGYYGHNVTYDTPVKIIRFTFNNEYRKSDNSVDPLTTYLSEVKLFADGGSRGNPGPSASGYAILDMHDNIVVKRGFYLGVTTNNQAEYQALKLGLEESARMKPKIVHVYMDSLLVINQMTGIFKISNRDLWPIHAAIKTLESIFSRVTYTHVPRELNKVADAAVNEALDQAAHEQA